MEPREGWASPSLIHFKKCVDCWQGFNVLSFAVLPDDWRCPQCDYWFDRRN